MKRRLVHHARARVLSTIVVLLAALPAAADVNVTQNIAFTANGRNPRAAGPAIEVSDSYTLLDIPHTTVNFPTINADPVGVALDALSDALGVPLPSLVKLQVGGSASGTAHVGVDFLVWQRQLGSGPPLRAGRNHGPRADRGHVVSDWCVPAASAATSLTRGSRAARFVDLNQEE